MLSCMQLLLTGLMIVSIAPTAFAQGGGTSSTGSVNGKVSDTSGAVLPGVNVTAVSPSLMGVQTSVTDAGGNYCFPALPLGVYAVSYQLVGFNAVKRERKLPRQVDGREGDCPLDEGLGRNVSGGTRPRHSLRRRSAGPLRVSGTPSL